MAVAINDLPVYKLHSINYDEMKIKTIDDIIVSIFKEIDKNKGLSKNLFPKQINFWGLLIAERLVKEGLKYTQLRRYVDALKEIELIPHWEDQKNKIGLFPVYLINGYARQNNLKMFSFLFTQIIEEDLIKEIDDFNTMLSLVDAITSYFNVLSKKENQND